MKKRIAKLIHFLLEDTIVTLKASLSSIFQSTINSIFDVLVRVSTDKILIDVVKFVILNNFDKHSFTDLMLN